MLLRVMTFYTTDLRNKTLCLYSCFRYVLKSNISSKNYTGTWDGRLKWQGVA